MRTLTMAASVLILFPACTQPEQRGVPNREADVKAIQKIMEDATAAHHASDAQRWVALFASDAVIMPAGDTTISGRNALVARITTIFDRYVSTATIQPVEIEVADDWAFARTAVSGAFTPKDGRPAIELDGKEIAIFRRQPDGSWKVARLIGNSNRSVDFPPR